MRAARADAAATCGRPYARPRRRRRPAGRRRGDDAPRHRRRRRWRARQARCTRSAVSSGARQREQLAQHVLGGGGLLAAARGRIAPRRWMRTSEPRFEQPQVLVERPAQVRQARVVGRPRANSRCGCGDEAATAHHARRRRARGALRRAAGRAGCVASASVTVDVGEALRRALGGPGEVHPAVVGGAAGELALPFFAARSTSTRCTRADHASLMACACASSCACSRAQALLLQPPVAPRRAARRPACRAGGCRGS